MNESATPKKPYQAPQLEQHTAWVGMTGVSLPIGTNALDNPLETLDFMDGEQ
jgi:hypothetical protein